MINEQEDRGYRNYFDNLFRTVKRGLVAFAVCSAISLGLGGKMVYNACTQNPIPKADYAAIEQRRQENRASEKVGLACIVLPVVPVVTTGYAIRKKRIEVFGE